MKFLFSVIIPVRNEEKTIGKLLAMLRKISSHYSTEIIVIDSGSTDSSVSIIKKSANQNPNLKLIEIKKDDFNHGETRNLGVKHARGEYVCFMSGDAIPINGKFYDYFLEDFKVDPRVVAVFGRQIPFRNTNYFQKLEHLSRFGRLNNYVNKKGVLVFDIRKPFLELNEDTKLLWYFIFDTFSCYKWSFLMRNPFQKTTTLEDFLMGKKIIQKKLVKIYDYRATIRHSHSLSLKDYYKQERDQLRVRFNMLNHTKETNILYKLESIVKDNSSPIVKSIRLGEFGLYYLIKLLILLEYKVSRVKL